jgi:AcrR family transcriptional regulator
MFREGTTSERQEPMGMEETKAERTELRDRIVEAARDIVSEDGLDGLSMRALALRIGYSPATIYLHFRDKDELLRSVMEEGFERLGATMEFELGRVGAAATAGDRLAAKARAYARFALENTGYFRAMFEIPGVARLTGCPAAHGAAAQSEAESLLREASAAGEIRVADVDRAALVGWGLMHGLTSLYLSGHLSPHVGGHEEFMELVEGAIESIRDCWKVG